MPELAVTADGTVGLLYALKNGTDLEVHFLRAYSGNFGTRSERVLATFPNNNPIKAWDPYIGDYFRLQAVAYDFFGAFSASGDPQPSHFPSGVYFQRNVKVGATIRNNFWLTSPGTLVNVSGQATVNPSIDPFVFYDLAPVFGYVHSLFFVQPFIYDPGDPFSGINHLSWPVLPATQPQFQLVSSPVLGPGANWTPANNPIIETNGQFLATVLGPQAQQYYRLRQNVASGQFHLFAAAGANGSLNPSGIFTNSGLGSQTFTATPSNNYAVSKWFLDGVPVQMGGLSLTVSNIADEHTLTATFAAFNDLAVTVAEVRPDEDPTLTFSTNSYEIDIENKGLDPLTGISMVDNLPANVDFVAAVTTQGTVGNSNGTSLPTSAR